MSIITLERHTVGSEGMSVDLILWQRFLRPMPGLFERLMALPENQHLEHCGFILPLGTVVTIPIEDARAAEIVPVISLWD
ncbi:phage tail protein [Hyphomicrobium sulfonivorans]|uniref:phage tail protein n=1 Tax=Hyphomicrobium sulfonivorans TaxID=121290 RepID=UPI0015714450|nr:phage tail protein [Hyphomicrobium sulfonivorans]MBI1649887.1 phage tail protein [Hyphomicrobium sulfonivorans]NSL71798.1 phage tail protein [Hyphomicrobium sulfonivorans]